METDYLQEEFAGEVARVCPEPVEGFFQATRFIHANSAKRPLWVLDIALAGKSLWCEYHRKNP